MAEGLCQTSIEMQNGVVLALKFSPDQVATGAADQDFFTRCIAARVSSVEHHTVMLVDETGRVIRREHFEHVHA
jgi:hypothetical protein